MLPSGQAWISVHEPLWQNGDTYRPLLRVVFLNASNEIGQIAREADYIKIKLLEYFLNLQYGNIHASFSNTLNNKI